MKKNKTGNKSLVEGAAEPVAPIDSPPVKPQEGGVPAERLRHVLPDMLKVAGALVVMIIAGAIWLTPPLIRSDFPKVSYSYQGNIYTNALLYRPLAMPTRYYIALPEKIADRYQVFAVDRRREVATLMTNDLSRTFLGMPAIKRSDPLGMDLEFRHLDNTEWHVFFLPEAILFSNAVLAVRLDVK